MKMQGKTTLKMVMAMIYLKKKAIKTTGNKDLLQ
jgi:hypothetical protein